MKTTMARFPFHESLESFDFKFQPVGLGLRVCALGYRTAFITAAGASLRVRWCRPSSLPEHRFDHRPTATKGSCRVPVLPWLPPLARRPAVLIVDDHAPLAEIHRVREACVVGRAMHFRRDRHVGLNPGHISVCTFADALLLI